MNRIKLYTLFGLSFLIISLLIFKYLNKPSNERNDSIEEENISVEGNRLKISERVRKQLYIETEELQWSSFEESISLKGEITADPDNTQSIGTRLPGRVIRFKKKEGDWVKRGEVLILFDSPEVARLRSKYNASLSKYQSANKNATRLKKLATMKLASDQDVRNAEAEAKNWEMELSSAKETLNLMNISPNGKGTIVSFVSPISGMLTQRLKAPGDIVTEHTNLAIVSDLSEVWFEARVYEQDLSRVQLGQIVKIKIPAYPEESWNGRISYLASSLDQKNRSVAARITIPNTDRKLKLGLYGNAIIQNGNTTIGEKAILIPEDSLIQISSDKGVIISLSDLEYEWRILSEESFFPVYEGKIPVINGLNEGERIVTEGTYSIKSLMLKSSFGETD